MSLKLCEKAIVNNDDIRLIDILPDELEEQQSIMIKSPTFTEINGTYKIWKYSMYGYIFKKTTPKSSISHLYYDHVDKYNNIYRHILRCDPALFGSTCVKIAKSQCYIKNNQEIEKWYVQDSTTLVWHKINNIEITKKIF